jgi:hypothetical protein
VFAQKINEGVTIAPLSTCLHRNFGHVLEALSLWLQFGLQQKVFELSTLPQSQIELTEVAQIGRQPLMNI